MLEEQVRQLKLGHKISYEAIKLSSQPTTQQQFGLVLQRLQSFEYGHITSWEALGYLTGVGRGIVAHPVATYRLLTKK